MKSVVLLSSGMDSTVNLYEAQQMGQVLLALTFDYGQRAAAKEIESARKVTGLLNIPLQVIDLPFFSRLGKSSLIDKTENLPLRDDISIDDLEISKKTAKSVWVPNRNGIFLNIAAGFAEAWRADTLVPGFNKEEATTFPDNSFEFISEVSKSLAFSTANKVQVHCFTIHMNKTEIVRRGNELKVDWKMIWPCYQAGLTWCGQCESCLRAQRAFKENGMEL